MLLTLYKSQKHEMRQLNFNIVDSAITFTFPFKKKYNIIRRGIILLFFISLGNAVLAQAEHKIYYYDNGNVSSEGEMEAGKPNGYWKTYYPNGQLKSEGNRKNFQLDSIWIFYNELGERTSSISYLEGKKSGEVKTFKNDVLYELSHFKNDVKVDESIIYYPTGEKKRIIPFDDGKENGKGFDYDLDGRIITLLEYEDGYLRRSEKINRYDNTGKKRGPWVDFHPNGVIAMEGYYMNDLKNGIFKTFDKKGDLITLEKYRDGQIVIDSEESIILDIRSTYYSDGTVKSSGGYVDGKKEGTHRIYDEEGNIVSGEVYSMGVKTAEGIVDQSGDYQGEWELYYDNGEIRAKGDYQNSLRTGDWVFYHLNGKIESEGKYAEGLPQGQWKWFYENGTSRRKDYYRRGKEDGESIEMDPEGNIISQGQYLGGYKDGEWFYHVGDHTEKGAYIDGEKDGNWIYQYENGKLSFEGEYIRGLATGKHKWYYPNGQVKKQGKYTSGVRVGTWEKFDEDGLKVLEVKYKQGREFKINGRKVVSSEDTEEEKIP